MSRHVPRRPLSVALLSLLALMVLLGGGSCGKSRRVGPNIVLIVIDTLRADHLPFYGYQVRDTAPFLTSLANRGTVFERTRSTSSWTTPATASIHTSLYPTQHTVLEGFRAVRMRSGGAQKFDINAIPPGIETIAEMLKGRGYSTFAVTDNINISPLEGFDQGFDRFWYSNDEGSKSVMTRLEENRATIQQAPPYFLCLHFMDPHTPYHKRAPWYQPQPDSLQDQIAAYDSEIRAVDDAIEQAYRMYGWDKNTLIVVTADHGEEFLEHGGGDHGRTLYEEVVHVPLMVRSTADSLPAGRIPTPVSALDILPTLRAYIGLPVDPAAQGISLWPAIRREGSLPENRSYFADLRTGPWFGNRTIKFVLRDNRKYILTLPNQGELYDLGADPGEKNNLAPGSPGEANELKSLLVKTESAWTNHVPVQRQVDLNREQVDRLRSLGYIN
jgi:arylsulfatase A-like enzyme